MIQNNAETVKTIYESFQGGDIDGILAHLAVPIPILAQHGVPFVVPNAVPDFAFVPAESLGSL